MNWRVSWAGKRVDYPRFCIGSPAHRRLLALEAWVDASRGPHQIIFLGLERGALTLDCEGDELCNFAKFFALFFGPSFLCSKVAFQIRIWLICCTQLGDWAAQVSTPNAITSQHLTTCVQQAIQSWQLQRSPDNTSHQHQLLFPRREKLACSVTWPLRCLVTI